MPGFRPENYPLEYAKAQRFLGMLYTDRIQGERYDNLERARQCFHTLLQTFSRETFPLDWATAQTLLGNVFLTTQVNRRDALERAIDCYQHSLRYARRRLILCSGPRIKQICAMPILSALRGSVGRIFSRHFDTARRLCRYILLKKGL